LFLQFEVNTATKRLMTAGGGYFRPTFAYNDQQKTDHDLIKLVTILGHDSITVTRIYIETVGQTSGADR
jgi:hypothetical protein